MTVDLAAIRRRYTETYREHQGHAWARGWPCCSAHGVADDVPSLIAALESAREERDRLAETVARVRSIHCEYEGRCTHCVEWCDCIDKSMDARVADCTHGNVEWPCATVRALDVPSGEQTGGGWS